MTTSKAALGLDIGTKRIGVAIAHAGISIAQPLITVDVDGRELDQIMQIYDKEGADICVIGLPRNMAGQETQQSRYTRQVAGQIESRGINITWQDEGLTSVKALEILSQSKKPHQKSDIDALAASLILQDYLEEQQ